MSGATRIKASPGRRKTPRPGASATSAHRLLQIDVELVEELVGGQPRVIGADQDCEGGAFDADTVLHDRVGGIDPSPCRRWAALGGSA